MISTRPLPHSSTCNTACSVPCSSLSFESHLIPRSTDCSHRALSDSADSRLFTVSPLQDKRQRVGAKRKATRTAGQLLMLISLSRLTELCGGNTEQAEKLHHVRTFVACCRHILFIPALGTRHLCRRQVAALVHCFYSFPCCFCFFSSLFLNIFPSFATGSALPHAIWSSGVLTLRFRA